MRRVYQALRLKSGNSWSSLTCFSGHSNMCPACPALIRLSVRPSLITASSKSSAAAAWVWSTRPRTLKLHRFVALKFLPDDVAKDPQALSRFRARSAGRSALNHPNICTIYEIGEQHGDSVHRHGISGRADAEASHRGQADGDRDVLLDLAIEIADALDAAHAEGIVHRDIKPATSSSPSADTPRFWISVWRSCKRKSASAMRECDADAGSDAADQSRRTLWARSRICRRSRRGRKNWMRARIVFVRRGAVRNGDGQACPFAGDSSAVIFDAILNRTPVAPVRLNPDVPPKLEEIINKALEKDRNLRYQHRLPRCAPTCSG